VRAAVRLAYPEALLAFHDYPVRRDYFVVEKCFDTVA
jgi:hypothetical protein